MAGRSPRSFGLERSLPTGARAAEAERQVEAQRRRWRDAMLAICRALREEAATGAALRWHLRGPEFLCDELWRLDQLNAALGQSRLRHVGRRLHPLDPATVVPGDDGRTSSPLTPREHIAALELIPLYTTLFGEVPHFAIGKGGNLAPSTGVVFVRSALKALGEPVASYAAALDLVATARGKISRLISARPGRST